MNNIMLLIEQFNSIVWTYLLPISFLMLGLYFTVKLKAFPQRHLGHGIRYLVNTVRTPLKGKGISPITTLALALSATIGIGNIVGVLAAIRLGGPGALFWMWIVGIIGMTLKYTETTLSIRYRRLLDNGYYTGGPMYYLRDGANSNLLASIFALFAMSGILLGIGTFPQVHSIVEIFTYTFDTPLFITALVLTFSVAAITLGGLKSIARIASIVMPFIIVLFISGCTYLLLRQASHIPQAFTLIFKSAFGYEAAAAGSAGYVIRLAIGHGARRGIFSNESGLGSAAIASATSVNDIPAQQGLVHVIEVVIDTLVINTLVGLLVIISGAYTLEGPEQALLDLAFKDPTYVGQITMTVSLVFFAFTSIVAWSFYGSQCANFMWGTLGRKYFRVVFVAVVFLAAFVEWDTIWSLSDLTTAVLVIPNIIGLFLLRNDIIEETEKLKTTMTNPSSNH